MCFSKLAWLQSEYLAQLSFLQTGYHVRQYFPCTLLVLWGCT